MNTQPVDSLTTGTVYRTASGSLYQFVGDRPYRRENGMFDLWSRDLRTGGRINVIFDNYKVNVQVLGTADPQTTTKAVIEAVPAVDEYL